MQVQCIHCKKRFEVVTGNRESDKAGYTIGSKGDYIFQKISDAGKQGITQKQLLLSVLDKWDKGLGRLQHVLYDMRKKGMLLRTTDGKLRLQDSYLAQTVQTQQKKTK